MPKLDIEALPIDTRTPYPPPFDRVVYGRERRRLGNAAGLDQFGVNLTTAGDQTTTIGRSVAAGADGRFVVAWVGPQSGGSAVSFA